MHCIAFSAPEEDVEESEPEEHAESAEECAAQVEVVSVGREEGGQAEAGEDERRPHQRRRHQRRVHLHRHVQQRAQAQT